MGRGAGLSPERTEKAGRPEKPDWAERKGATVADARRESTSLPGLPDPTGLASFSTTPIGTIFIRTLLTALFLFGLLH
jgi:hypothetical protein